MRCNGLKRSCGRLTGDARLNVTMNDGSKTIKFDPRDFICGPYQDCPKCGQHEFGVLSIHENSYTRRCRSRECWYTRSFGLPKLRKKIIYLDQLVFSNIMKMLRGGTPGHERAKSEPLWRELFESLDVLCRMQVVICPDSTEHRDESLISPFYQELKHTYEHFSTGISFSNSISIEEKQIAEAFTFWLKNEKPDFDSNSHRVTHGNPHRWQDHIFVTTDGMLPGYKQMVQERRQKVHCGLSDLFKQWQVEKKTFEEVFEREKSSYAKSILQGIEQDRQKMTQMQSLLEHLGPLPRSITQFSMTMNTPLMLGLEWIATMRLIEQDSQELHDPETVKERAREKVIAFVESGAMSDAPSNVIAASMYAALSRKAAAGQKKLPDEGMAADIRVVSALLPYCDAMFVDNYCRSLLDDIPQTHRLPYKCLVFSSKTSPKFVEYLRGIRDTANAEHLKLLEEVYGPNALEPRKSIYGVGARKRPVH
jgi:hypothetical protein